MRARRAEPASRGAAPEGAAGKRTAPERAVSGRPVAVVGRLDRPVDGVRDFCAALADALARLGAGLDLLEVRWDEGGWRPALAGLRAGRATWAGRPALVQHTHGMWPWRGVPLGVLPVMRVLQRHGSRVTLVLHDPWPFPGTRLRDRLRRAGQLAVMRRAVQRADAVVTTVAPERVPWMARLAAGRRAVLIPVGSAVPEPAARAAEARAPERPRRVVVFGVTGGSRIAAEVTTREVADVAHALTRAARAAGPIHVDVVGRGSAEAASLVASALAGTGVTATVHGLLSLEALARVLGGADALLCARGALSTRRTTAIAGVSAGVPVVGYAGADTGPPLDEAGVLLAPHGDRRALGEALARVLSDGALARELRERSRLAHARHFAWPVIARRYLEVAAGA